jgi:uncharacterized protein
MQRIVSSSAQFLGLGAAAAALIPSAAAGQTDSARAPSPFVYDRTAALELSDSLLREESGVLVHVLSFASPKGGRATGLLFVPRDSGRFPGIVVQHGAPGTAGTVESLALAIARRGAVVVALDAPWARRNAPPFSFTPQDSVDQVQLIVDLQRAVDLLLARKDVHPLRLGYVGRSYGAAMGALLAGVERRLVTYVLQVGDGGLVAHFTGPDDLPGPPRGVTPQAWQRWLAAMQPMEPIRFVRRAAPASLYFQSARRDELIPLIDAERFHRAGSRPKVVSWYDSGHRLNEKAMTDMLQWLHRTVAIRAP